MGDWSGRRLLVVVAHPDDETFGLGSVIARAARLGADVTVCCATRGEAGEVVGDVDVSPGLAVVRERELRAAAAVLGAREVVLLPFGDSDMTGEPPTGSLVAAPLEDVVTAVADVVARVRPDVVVTLDPEAGDGHRDHDRIGAATTEAVRRAAPDTHLYWWVVRRELLQRWLDALRAARPDAGHLDLDAEGLGRPSEQVTTVVDTTADRAVREAAVAEHRSQRPPHADMPAEIAGSFLTEDALVRVVPAWDGGELETDLLLPPT
ncbi:MAG: PIG-L deacetylase family protein [Actinomycetes bacterium]